MRNTLLGSLLGLAIGIMGAFAYNNYLGDGQKLAQAQADLADALANLAKATKGAEQLKSDTDAASAQLQQVVANNDALKRQLDELKKSIPPGAPPAATNPMAALAANPMIAGMVKAQLARRQGEKLLLLKSRLHLTPEQEVTLKAAMDEESARMEEMTAKMFQGGKVDPQAMMAFRNGNSTTVDQTLDGILTPDQKTAYTQMQDDQKKSQAETSATFEMNQVAPLLQLSEAQKDQVYSTLYQLRLNPPTPTPSTGATPSDPGSFMEAQAKAKEDALSKVLTPDQLATYHQQAQSQLEMQKTMMQRFMPPSGSPPPVAPPPP